jgi:hypothetical protein
MISTNTDNFPWKKNDPNSPDFKQKRNSQSPDFDDKFPVGSQEYRKILLIFLLSYLVYSQNLAKLFSG